MMWIKTEVSKKYEEAWEDVKKEIETTDGSKKLNIIKIFKKLDSSLMMIC